MVTLERGLVVQYREAYEWGEPVHHGLCGLGPVDYSNSSL